MKRLMVIIRNSFKLLVYICVFFFSFGKNCIKFKGLFKSLNLSITKSTSETFHRKHHLCFFSIGEAEERK